MAITQIPRYTSVIQADDNATANTVVVRDGSGGINVANVAASSIANSGPVAVSLISRTANYTAAGETVILCDATSGNITITLPAASGVSGRLYVVKKTDASANTVTIDGSGSETIDGATTVALASQHHYRGIVSNGSNWFVVSQN